MGNRRDEYCINEKREGPRRVYVKDDKAMPADYAYSIR
jgi:hypothetical protein